MILIFSIYSDHSTKQVENMTLFFCYSPQIEKEIIQV